MFDRETVVVYAMDFFGEAARDASLSIEREGRVVFEGPFVDGRLEIKIPTQLLPGVYDLVAYRGSESYRVNSYMIPLATHYFKHARLHSDTNFTGGNLDPETILSRGLMDPTVYASLDRLPPDLKADLDAVSLFSGNSGVVCHGGHITCTPEGLDVSSGEIISDGKLYSFGRVTLPYPEITGLFSVGLRDGEIVLTEGALDFKMASVAVDSSDFIRLSLSLTYHGLERDGEQIYFVGYETTTREADLALRSGRFVSGLVSERGVHGRATAGSEAGEVSLTLPRGYTGPVIKCGRLYVYASYDYALLFDISGSTGTLMCATPRSFASSGRGSTIILSYGPSGVTFNSVGPSGEVIYRTRRPYPRSSVLFRTGESPREFTRPLTKLSRELERIARDEDLSDHTVTKTAGAQLVFDQPESE